MRRSLLAVVGILSLLVPAVSAGAGQQKPLAVEQLGKIITGVPDHTAKFHETRRLTLLSEPVELEGRLVFHAPDRLEKHTLVPQREDLVVDGQWVNVSLPDQNTEMRFNIADDPVLHGLLFSLQSLLNGKPENLSRIFTLEAWGDSSHWTLRLKPVSAEMKKRLQILRVTGEGRWLRTIELWETSGDYMIMTIDAESAE